MKLQCDFEWALQTSLSKKFQVIQSTNFSNFNLQEQYFGSQSFMLSNCFKYTYLTDKNIKTWQVKLL